MTLRSDVVFEFVYPEEPLSERFERADSHGVDGVEILGWHNEDMDEIISGRDQTGLDIVCITSAGGGNPVASGIDDETICMTNGDAKEQIVDDIRDSIEVAERLEAKNIILTVGSDQQGKARSEQRQNVISVLSAVSQDAEAAGVTLLIEPLNSEVDFPNHFLSSSYEGYELIEAIDSENVKLLYDFYHQQITEGNLINNIVDNIEHIGHFHIADVPQRHQPGTGELHFKNIFKKLDESSFDGYVGFEFDPESNPDSDLRDAMNTLP